MYLPSAFAENRPEVLSALIRAHPLATFITQCYGEIEVNHVPMILTDDQDKLLCLQAHVPRANSLWQHLQQADAVAVFHGPQAYITPSWYPGKTVHGKVVPTWNYAVVQVRGRARAVDDAAWLLAHLQALTRQQEADQTVPWQVSDAPREYTEQLVDHLVGIELPVTHIQGKWKISQNRAVEDQQGVSAGLRAQDPQLAELMRQYDVRR